MCAAAACVNVSSSLAHPLLKTASKQKTKLQNLNKVCQHKLTRTAFCFSSRSFENHAMNVKEHLSMMNMEEHDKMFLIGKTAFVLGI